MTVLALQSSTAYLLARLGAESRRRWSEVLTTVDLAPSHYVLLMTLDEVGPTHLRRLSDIAGFDARNTVPLADLLADRGLIRRGRDRSDRRRLVIALSDEGRLLIRRLRRESEEAERAMLSGLDREERAVLQRLLAKLFGQALGDPGLS